MKTYNYMDSQTYTFRNVFLKSCCKTNILIKVLILSLLLLSSCYTSRFTPDNALKLKVGMTSAEVVAIFGKPKKTSAMTCGSSTSRPWSCILWYYGDYTPYFTFQQGEDGVLYLNSWTM
jgi:hypothetical protein